MSPVLEKLRRPVRSVRDILEHWQEDPRIARNLVLETCQDPRDPRLSPWPHDLPEGVQRALRARKIESLFAHQAQALRLARDGHHTVVATPTASGKSLCYNLPVLDQLGRDPHARALYLFPTKALARDQEAALMRLLQDAGLNSGAVTFDGDTPGDARRAAKERAGVVLTNPDMLHAGMLPHHTTWARLFADLRYVVIDELHAYRGVFGSHLANVVRRLRRVAEFHGSQPTFLFASATIGNPGEHATRIAGQKVALVGENGAPRGPRHVVFYNPPVVNAELGIRQSYLKATVRLTMDLVRGQVPTLVFGQSRNAVEVMLKYLRDRLSHEGFDPDCVHAYRGGYLPQTRREIERRLRDGDILCVVATNALELGIDVGALDAVVSAGYPGSVASLWQRFGRAGRRGAPSLAVLVGSSAPLDQYFALQPEALVTAPVEKARIDPDNIEILIQHLKCGAFELPFEEGTSFGDVPGDAVQDALDFLTEHEVVHPSVGPSGKTVYHWSTDSYPASHVSLRSVGWDNVVIVNAATGETLAEMDWRSAHTMLHEQAIYQHGAQQYQVEKLDLENRKAFVRHVDPGYYTTAKTHTKVTVIEEEDMGTLRFGTEHFLGVGLGEVSVVEKVVGFKKIRYHTHENVGYGDVRLPEMQMHTTSFWLTFPVHLVEAVAAPRASVVDALRGLGQAMHTVAAADLMVDPNDLGRTLNDQDPAEASADSGPPQLFDPTLFLFDRIPGGVGLASQLYADAQPLLERTRDLIEACPCERGCPACIGPSAGVDETTATSHRKALLETFFGTLGLRLRA